MLNPLSMTSQQRKASHALIRRGNYSHLMTPDQKQFYQMVDEFTESTFFWLAARKSGKSYSIFLYVLQFVTKYRNYPRPILVRWIFPSIKLAKEVVPALWEELKNSIPEDMWPRYLKAEGRFIFPWGAQICLGGGLPENQDNNRGPYMSLLILDECAFFDAPTFVSFINGVLKPQATHYQDIVKYLYITTPPDTLDHPAFTNVLSVCKGKSTYKVSTIYDNIFLNENGIQKIADELGGVESEAFKREYLCELIARSDRRVCPEFNSEDHVGLYDPYERDPHTGETTKYAGLISVDYGVKDFCGILSAYYNHIENILVITDEHMEKSMGLRKLKDTLDIMQEDMYDYSETIDITVDAFEQSAFELRHEYMLTFRRPTKAKVEDQIGLVRNALVNNRILIDPKCKNLIAQLELGMWKKTEKVGDFERSEQFGHLDLIAALCYLVKSTPWGRRPGQHNFNKLTIGRRKK